MSSSSGGHFESVSDYGDSLLGSIVVVEAGTCLSLDLEDDDRKTVTANFDGELGEVTGIEYEGTYLNQPKSIWAVIVKTRLGKLHAHELAFREATEIELRRYELEGQLDTPEFHRLQARFCVLRGDYGGAASHFLALAELRSSDVDTWLLAGEYFVCDQDFASAVWPLKNFLEQCPSDLEGRLFYACCLLQTHQEEEAKNLLAPLRSLSDEEFRRLDIRCRGRWDIEFGREYTPLRSGWDISELAYVNLPIWQEGARRFPDSPDSWHDLAVTYEECGQMEEAKEAYARYERMKPPTEDTVETSEESEG